MANSADPDQTASLVYQSDQGLLSQNIPLQRLRITMVNTEYMILKGIGLQRIYLISEESCWRDLHFAAHFMKIDGSVS